VEYLSLRAGIVGLSVLLKYRVFSAEVAPNANLASLGSNWTFSARLAVNCNVGAFVATPVPLVENVSQVIAIIGFGGKWHLGLPCQFSKLAGSGFANFAAVSPHAVMTGRFCRALLPLIGASG
jgi:hypothetical protein